MKVIDRFIGRGLAFIAGLLLWSLPVTAQNKYLAPSAYDQWNYFSTGAVSDDGLWSSYTMRHAEHKDTLYLQNSRTGFRYSFPSATQGQLTPDGRWFAFHKDNSLNLLEVTSGTVLPMEKAASFEFATDGSFLLVLKPDNTLVIRDMESGKNTNITDVKEYKLGHRKLAVVLDKEQNWQVGILELGKDSIVPIAIVRGQCSGLQWNAAGNALAFYESTDSSIAGVHFYNLKFGHRFLNPALSSTVSEYGAVVKNKLHLSEDGERLFFDVAAKEDTTVVGSDVQVWRSVDKQLSSRGYESANKSWRPRWYLWWPLNGKVKPIESDQFNQATLLGDSRHALLRSNAPYLPKYKFGEGYQDIYLADLETGATKLVLEKIADRTGSVVTSPSGRYLAYYTQGNWWRYDRTSGKHLNITAGLGTQWEDNAYDRAGFKPLYGCGGWTANDREILLYDQFDIWIVPLESGKPRRMTHGAADGIRYRIATEGYSSLLRDGDFGYVSKTYKLKDRLLLKIEEPRSGRMGVAVWKAGKGTVTWRLENRKVLWAGWTADKKSIRLIESAFDVAPRLLQLNAPMMATEIVRSNRQQKQYAWGRSELVSYEVGGKTLQGVLCYPAGFDPAKKYPMVVFIYEKLSKRLHDYDAPTLGHSIGFNRTNFTLEGYFVLMPDISYSMDAPGRSALDCVTAAVDKVMDLGYIDSKRMGLYGHSFGGFEVAYIASQSRLFRTVVSGSGVHNLRGFYLGMDVSDRSNMERFWSGQLRNSIAFEEEDFDKESPLRNVSTIDTPMLLWTGATDTNVPPWHSTQLHTALWRLGKKSTLLVYPDEEHTLSKEVNKLDLSNKIAEWFGHYLKDEPVNEWMK